jgi:hypothetical protein
MIATSVRNPVTGVDYLWPRAKQKVTATDQRRVSIQHVPGADGAMSQYGLNPFPRGETMVTISFRVTPRARGTTFDALRTLLNLAVDHGLPQRLTFTDDAGNPWFATGYLTGKNLDYDENQQWFADWSLTFLLEDPLAQGPVAGVNTWGQTGLKWGDTGLKWGATPHSVALTAASVQYVLANPIATAETRDMVFTFTGAWGSSIGQPNNNGYFTVYNLDIIDLSTAAPVQFTVPDNIPAGYTYQIDCGSGGVYKTNSLASPPIAQPQIAASDGLPMLRKPPMQLGYMRFRPQGNNTLQFTIAGPPLGTLNGKVVISWRPKLTLS